MEYLVKAAEKGLRAAMLEVARALDTGLGLGAAADNSSSTTPQRYAICSAYDKNLSTDVQ